MIPCGVGSIENAVENSLPESFSSSADLRPVQEVLVHLFALIRSTPHPPEWSPPHRKAEMRGRFSAI